MNLLLPPSTPAESRAQSPALVQAPRAGSPPPWFGTALVSLPLFLAACGDAKVSSYRIPKEQEPPAAVAVAGTSGAAAMPGSVDMAITPVARAEGTDLVWTVPSQWKSKPSSSMRKGSYTVGDDAESAGELAITAFPGDVGGDLANVNRWLGQLQLPPVTTPELAGIITRMDQNGLAISFVDLERDTSPSKQSMIGAIVPFNGSTWFFKLTGPNTVVAKAKPDFLAFLQTIKLPASSTASAGGSGTAPVASPAPGSSAMAGSVVPTDAGPGLAWTAPVRWQSKPGSAMRKGSFAVPGDDGAAADLSITAFPGAVGGELANLNRWRGQLSLPPLKETELAAAVTQVKTSAFTFTIVDCAGTGAGAQRIVGAMVPYQGAMWFFKMIGPEALVAREKSAFLEFLQTVHAAAIPTS